MRCDVSALSLLSCLVCHLSVVSSRHLPERRSQGSRIQQFLSIRTSPPESVIMTEGRNLKLECSAGVMGPTEVTIMWLYNGRPLSQGATTIPSSELTNPRNSIAISKALGKLVVPCFSAQNVGRYTCRAYTNIQEQDAHTIVSMADTNDESAELRSCLTSLPEFPPTIVMANQFRVGLQGQNIRLFCRAVGNPAPTVSWSRADQDIFADNDNYRVTPVGDLIIHNADWARDMGQFTCKVANSAGNDNATVFIYPTVYEISEDGSDEKKLPS